MRRTSLVLSVAFVLVAVAAVPIAGLAASDAGVAAQQANDNGTGNASNADVAPGERLSGVLGVGEAELETEVDSRTFGLKVAKAASNDSARADVVAEQRQDVEERLDELEQRKETLDRARENGSMSEGAYRARLADLAAETEGAERLANESENASEGLPAEMLEAKGINATAIQTLQDRASELGGPQVAEIARSIAGNAVGKAPDHAGPDRLGPPGDGQDRADRGPDADRGNASDRGDGGDSGPGDRTETPGDDADGSDGQQNTTTTAPSDSGPGDSPGGR